MAVDLDGLKAGMRRLAAGVTVITTIAPEGGRAGLTATAVTSVTGAPPTLLVCVNRSSRSCPLIAASGIFAVNVLSVRDRAIAGRFAGGIPQEERFLEGDWKRLSTGAPVLETALVAFDCKLAESVEQGSHCVFFGQIEAIHLGDHGHAPLLYGAARYGTFDILPDRH
jgi:flavin reductase (NADH)/flavin reductase